MDVIIALIAVCAAGYAVYWYVKRERANNKQVDVILDKIEADLKEATDKAAQIAETVKVEAVQVAEVIKVEAAKVEEVVKVEAAKVEEKTAAAVKEVKAKTKQTVAKVGEKAKAAVKGRKPKK